uniref:HTH CENPB-type domain-containing protein n=1 Tax=Eptatretus burgeri TaxID=7764 RepID=A0A8C4Q776_EPTBU
MSAKKKGDESCSKSDVKRQRITLVQKVEILDKLDKGEGSSSVARGFGLNESTVRTVKRNETKIRESVAATAPYGAQVSCYTRDTTLQNMEKALIRWIEDQVQRRVPLDGPVIREKAKRLFEDMKPDTPSTSRESSVVKHTHFRASTGWFEKFKKRYALRNVKLVGKLASSNHETSKKFPPKRAKLIEEKGYKPEQIFIAEETGLFWKKMSKRTFLTKQEKSAPGFQAVKDRLTALLCSNTSGDCMVKTLLPFYTIYIDTVFYRRPEPTW